MANRVFHFCALLAFAVLQGCGSGDKSAPVSQVAARVNGGEITIYRVNNALAAMDNPEQQMLAKTRRSVLDSLIEQELAAQAAEDSKLDRTPAVVQAIEAARRELLARAWLEQVSATLSKPGAAEVSRYYAEHPELFARRRVYNLQQIMLTAEPALLNELRQKVEADTPLQKIGNWLEQKQVKYSALAGVRAAEKIPLDIIADLSKASDGQTLLIEQPKSALIIHVASSSLQPVAETDAAPRIRKFLANQAWTEAIATEMKRLKQRASITYLGEFASSAPELPQASGAGGAASASLANLEKEEAQP